MAIILESNIQISQARRRLTTFWLWLYSELSWGCFCSWGIVIVPWSFFLAQLLNGMLWSFLCWNCLFYYSFIYWWFNAKDLGMNLCLYNKALCSVFIHFKVQALVQDQSADHSKTRKCFQGLWCDSCGMTEFQFLNADEIIMMSLSTSIGNTFQIQSCTGWNED
jgi:hypothetical protein